MARSLPPAIQSLRMVQTLSGTRLTTIIARPGYRPAKLRLFTHYSFPTLLLSVIAEKRLRHFQINVEAASFCFEFLACLHTALFEPASSMRRYVQPTPWLGFSNYQRLRWRYHKLPPFANKLRQPRSRRPESVRQPQRSCHLAAGGIDSGTFQKSKWVGTYPVGINDSPPALRASCDAGLAC